jgi:hypothetical protein
VPFWQDLGRALRGIFSAPEGEAVPEEFDEEEPEFGEEPPEEPPYNPPPSGGDFFGGGDDSGDRGFPYYPQDNPGPYPDNWNAPEQKLWDDIMGEFIFSSEEEYERLQDMMEKGWMEGDISTEDRNYYREEFLDEAYFATFDWGAFQEYYDSI